MSDPLNEISKVWKDFPTEFINPTLHDAVKNLKKEIENSKYFFNNYLMKIVIIGNISTGKSTLINALIGKKYFGTTTGNSTVAFFYCSLSGKDYEYFTINNCQIEHKNIESLLNASKLNSDLPDYFNHNTVIKIYMKHNEVLKRKTILIDCPGFGNEECDKEIRNHCLNADMFIFMFQIGEPVTLMQKNFIQNIRQCGKTPTCLFVYNKCDESKFNESMKTALRANFIELLAEQFEKDLKLNIDPLYFISATLPDMFEDFTRLKTDIKNHKDIYYHQYGLLLSNISDEIKKFLKKLSNIGSNEKQKITSLKRINEMKNQILEYVKRHIDDCKNNLLLDIIFDKIIGVIYDSDEKCDKYTASIMICNIDVQIKNAVKEFVENHIRSSCIDEINEKLQEIRDETEEIIIINDIHLSISRDHLIIPTYRNIENIFWWFETGDKTKKVQETFTKFLQSEANKKQIIDSIKNVYNSEFAKIQTCIQDFLDKSSSENIESLENKLRILLDYEKNVNEYYESYKSCCLA